MSCLVLTRHPSLLVFVVGELEFIEDTTTSGTPVRVYTTPGKVEQGRFALAAALKAIVFLEEYFDFPFQVPKTDMVAIPLFSAGAMENC